ncbi:HlyD family type I secretion periplasmic adaptor subunit [Desulfobotulus mexicanus]|nr:HlyD family type I secretion periplasmic adaptor subunit [Desulfobotulus mexicanus]
MQNPQIPKPDTNPAKAIFTGFAILILGFFSFVFWAVTAPLDKGIVCQGIVSVETHRKAVQHLYGGIVDAIYVRENQPVKKDELLIRLSDVRPRAEYAAVRSEYISAKATHARLLAERLGHDSIAFPADLLLHKDSVAEEILHTQRELFSSRRGSLLREKEILEENIGSQQRYIETLESALSSRTRQASLLLDEISDLQELVNEGHYPRNNLLTLERSLEEVNSRRSEDIGNISRANGHITELRLRILKLDQDFQKEVESGLSETQRRLASLMEQYEAVKDVLRRTEIRSPDDGIVLSLETHTIGGVISPGQKIMEIVPSDSLLIIEAQIQPKDIDRVHGDMKADLRFSAFDTRNTPVIEGDVFAVSPDRLIDQNTRMPYYMAKIAIPHEELERLGRDRQLVPGMPAEVVIKTGERTLLRYLIDPFIERLFVSFKEE